MSWRQHIARLRGLLGLSRRVDDLDEEIRAHLGLETEEHRAAGLSADEARYAARCRFGNVTLAKEESRDMWIYRSLEIFLQDVRYGLRMLGKNPGFTIVAVLTLALGIGANSAVFSAIDAILLRPLPFPNGDQLMRVDQSNPKVPIPFVAPTRLEDWNRLNSTFQAITGYYTEDASETSGALPEKVTQAWVAPRFLQVWGVAPALGRDFNSEELRFGGPSAALISDRFWRQHFGGDPSAIGKKLRISGGSYLIAGIMPGSFLFPIRAVDLWCPIPVDSPYAGDRNSTWYTTIGRVKPGVTVEQARANLATVQAQLGRQFPKTDADLAVRIHPLKEITVGGVRSSLWVLFGSVSLLLLIACTNIVALLLARGAQRQHEVAVRFSLGASRAAVIRQLLAEALVLALAGAALGLAVAGGASKVFRALAAGLPRVEEIHLDGRIVLYSLACSVVVTLLCGLVPALRCTRRKLSGSLAQANRTQVSARNPLQWTLTGVQVALAVTLLAGAGLLLRSFQELGRVSPGFDPSHVLTFHISGSYGETADMKGLTQRIDRTIDSLASVPGVEAAATAAVLPGVPSHYQTELKVAEGETDPDHKIVAESRFVSPGYFATLRIPLLAGETCRENLSSLTSLNVVVNRSFANTYFAGAQATGRHLDLPGSFALQGQIRGIVGDAREEGMNREPGPVVYWCVSAPGPGPFYLVRTRTEPKAMAETIRLKAHEVEPNRSVFDIAPLEDQINETFGENRLRTVLLAFFAITAVSLACIGLYGTLSYSVNTRRREIGLRLALGALRGQIVKNFLLQGLGVSLIGCAAGWGLAVASSSVLSGMLYGVSPSDPATLSSVVFLVLVVAAAASLLPAIRAARVDPMQVLREE